MAGWRSGRGASEEAEGGRLAAKEEEERGEVRGQENRRSHPRPFLPIAMFRYVPISREKKKRT